jgi:hypothetical protein
MTDASADMMGRLPLVADDIFKKLKSANGVTEETI